MCASSNSVQGARLSSTKTLYLLFNSAVGRRRLVQKSTSYGWVRRPACVPTQMVSKLKSPHPCYYQGNAPPWYALERHRSVCINGHFITAYAPSLPEKKRNFCTTCGADTIDACPRCETSFEGAIHFRDHPTVFATSTGRRFCLKRRSFAD